MLLITPLVSSIFFDVFGAGHLFFSTFVIGVTLFRDKTRFCPSTCSRVYVFFFRKEPFIRGCSLFVQISFPLPQSAVLLFPPPLRIDN